ncbi:hypothetical protein [Azospirillum argentinense]
MMGGAVLSIRLDGPVVGKGRPRFVRATGRTYTPAATEHYEGALRLAAQSAMSGRALIERPCSVEVHVDVIATEGWPAWKRAGAISGGVAATGKPDIDNIAKIVMDAFNKVVWLDDSLVTDLRVSKAFADRPGLTIYVQPLDAAPANAKRRYA